MDIFATHDTFTADIYIILTHHDLLRFAVALRPLHLPCAVGGADRVLVSVLADEALVDEPLDEGRLAAELLAQEHHFHVDVGGVLSHFDLMRLREVLDLTFLLPHQTLTSHNTSPVQIMLCNLFPSFP